MTGEKPSSCLEIPEMEDFSVKEKLALEKNTCGISLSGSILDEYSDNISDLRYTTLAEIVSYDETEARSYPFKDKQSVNIVGAVSKIQAKETRSGERMLFVTLEDSSFQIELLVFPKQVGTLGYLFTQDSCLFVTGNISLKEGERPKILVSKALPLIPNGKYVKMPKREAAKDKKATLYLRVKNTEARTVAPILGVLAADKGSVSVVFYDSSEAKYVKAVGVTTGANDKTLCRLRDMCGEANVILKES
ncbi:MAG: hypothetical protein IJ519_00540, partial [Clostridia bacterium]|nr:hypothetical protein [Clostridia bacterium]